MAPLWKKVYHDCAVFAVHNQTAAFLYKLRQPCDLGDMAGVVATGQGMLQVSDHAMLLNGTPNSWILERRSDRTLEGGGASYAITRRVAGPGSRTLPLDCTGD